MSSKDRIKTSTPPSSLPSSPSMKSKKSSSPSFNRKSMKLDVPKSFTIDVNQISVARKQLKNVGKVHTPEELSSITLEAPEKQGNLLIMMPEATSWVQLWCVLKEGRLYIFPNSKTPAPDKILSMHGSKVGDKKLPGVEYCFQINTRGGETLLFRTDEDFEYVTWIVSLRGATLYLKISSYVIDTPRRETNTSSQSTPSTSQPASSSQLASSSSSQPASSSLPSSTSATSLPTSPPPSASLPTSTLPSASLPPLPSSTKPASASPSTSAPSSPTSATSPTSPNFQNTSPISRRPTQSHVQKSPNFAPSSPALQEKSPYRNSTGVSPLPSEAPRFSPDVRNYRKSADISKLTKAIDLSDVVSAAYRKSADLSKTATPHSPQLPHSSLAHSPQLTHSPQLARSVSLTHSNNSLFASAEIISNEKDDQDEAVKTKRGMLGVPAGGLFNKWKQRWVVLANDSLSVYKQEEDEEKQGKEPMHSFEIIFCQPKVVQSEKGKNIFEIHAPGRTIQFGASSSVVLLEWITCIQETQTALMQSYLQYNLNASNKKAEDGDSENKQQLELELEKSKKKLADIMKLPGNNQCADCGAPDPLWATINFGVFICIECSGVHRQMGTHISKVRSITMDKWDSEVLEFMESHGNVKVNAELEHNILPQYTKLTPSSSRQERDAFIKAKYDEKLFAEK